jgi:hypothetical protein
MDEPELKTAYRKREGNPISQYFGLIAEGFVTQADLDNPDFPVSTFGTVKVGDLKYKDANGDGFIDDRDESRIGYSDIPENTYALSWGVNYQGWGFSVMFQGVDHVSRYYDAEAKYAFVSGGKVKKSFGTLESCAERSLQSATCQYRCCTTTITVITISVKIFFLRTDHLFV